MSNPGYMDQDSYQQLLDGFPEHVRRNIESLRAILASLPPPSEGNLLVAGWKMDGGNGSKFTPESAIYILEISKRFDLMVVQSDGSGRQAQRTLLSELSSAQVYIAGEYITFQNAMAFQSTLVLYDPLRMHSATAGEFDKALQTITPKFIRVQGVFHAELNDRHLLVVSVWPIPQLADKSGFTAWQLARKFSSDLEELRSEDHMILVGDLTPVQLHSGSLSSFLDHVGISSSTPGVKGQGIAVRTRVGQFELKGAGSLNCFDFAFGGEEEKLYADMVPAGWSYAQWRATQLSPASLSWVEIAVPVGGLKSGSTHAPDWPVQLVEGLARGDAVLFAGAGIGAQAGLPVWRSYVEHLFDVAKASGIVDGALASAMSVSLARGQHGDVADSIALRAWPNPTMRQVILDDLRTTFEIDDRQPSPVHRVLSEIKFRALLTTNFDSLLDRSFDGPGLLPQQTERLKELIAKKDFFKLHLYGLPESEESLLLTSLQFSEFLDHSIAFGEALSSLYVSSPFFFVGCSFEGIQGYLSGIRLSPSSVQHFALLDISAEPLWKTRADVLKLRYGINVIPFELRTQPAANIGN